MTRTTRWRSPRDTTSSGIRSHGGASSPGRCAGRSSTNGRPLGLSACARSGDRQDARPTMLRRPVDDVGLSIRSMRALQLQSRRPSTKRRWGNVRYTSAQRMHFVSSRVNAVAPSAPPTVSAGTSEIKSTGHTSAHSAHNTHLPTSSWMFAKQRRQRLASHRACSGVKPSSTSARPTRRPVSSVGTSTRSQRSYMSSSRWNCRSSTIRPGWDSSTLRRTTVDVGGELRRRRSRR